MSENIHCVLLMLCGRALLNRPTTRIWARLLITHITDIEGNGDKFRRVIGASTDLILKEGPKGPSLSFSPAAAPHSQFVYGGDIGDKGANSLRLLRMLVDFKKREPQRVHLIIGNREAKMTRVIEELNQCCARDRLLQSPAVFWNKGNPPSVYADKEKRRLGIQSELREFVYSLPEIDCEVLYVKWMLAETMGCGVIKPGSSVDTFELLRREIAEIEAVTSSEISDRHVWRVLRAEVQKDGAYWEYLSHGVLMHRIGDSLFLHGAVTPQNLGRVPGLTNPLQELDSWIHSMNAWYRVQLNLWKTGATTLVSSTCAPGNSALMHYMVQNPVSVVTTNWYDPGRLIAPLEDKIVEYLLRGGVRRAVTGHQPFSDFPLVLRHETGFEVIVGDTSYSDESDPLNNQGIAFHTLEIDDKISMGDVTASYRPYYSETEAIIRAVRKNGKKQVVKLSNVEMSNFGKVVKEGVLRFDEEGAWVVSQLSGFRIMDTPHIAAGC